MKYVKLNNGIEMPIVGYGVLRLDDEECERCVLDAIDVGYRLIDTAQGYGNERAVGRAIKKCSVPREELFITTKLWISGHEYEKAKQSIEGSLERLQLDYVDLLLIHHPYNDYYGAYRAMEEYYKAGKIKAIGVSNFYPDRLVDLIKFNEIVPAVNQVETHVFNQQVKAREIMTKYGVQIQAWAPLAQGRNDVFNNEILKTISEKHNKSIAQVMLRFLIQNGVTAVSKTTKKERMKENLDLFDFELTNDEMVQISAFDKAESLFFSHADPAQVERFASWERTF